MTRARAGVVARFVEHPTISFPINRITTNLSYSDKSDDYKPTLLR